MLKECHDQTKLTDMTAAPQTIQNTEDSLSQYDRVTPNMAKLAVMKIVPIVQDILELLCMSLRRSSYTTSSLILRSSSGRS